MFDLFEDILPELKNTRPAPKPKVKMLKVPFGSVCQRCRGLTTPRLFVRKYCDTCSQPQPKKPHIPKTRIVECLRCKIPLTLVGQGASKKLCPTCKELSFKDYKKRELAKLHTDAAYKQKLYAANNAREEAKRRARGAMTMAEFTELQRARSEARRLAEPSKTCKICGESKLREQFSKGATCNTCHNKIKYQREMRSDHPKKAAMLKARNVREEQQVILKRFDLFAPEKAEAKRLTKLRARAAERSTTEGRLNRNISELVRLALKKNKTGWRSSVGWTMPELKAHLEKHFRFGMSWGNYGKWHLDHIKPRSLFTFSSPHDPQFKECWALSNLQPLWAGENLAKNSTYPCPYHDNVMVVLS